MSGSALQRNVFYWAREKKHKSEELKGARKHETIKLEEVAVNEGIPAQEVIDDITIKLKAETSCGSLPFTLFLVVSYAGMIISHDQAPVVNAVEDSIKFDVEDNAEWEFSPDDHGNAGIYDVSKPDHFWSWMLMGFVPLLFDQEPGFSDTVNDSEPFVQAIMSVDPPSNRGIFLEYNRIVFGVRMSQERYEGPASCKNLELEQLYNKECVGGGGYELDPEMFDARRTVNPTSVVYLPIIDDVDDVLERVRELEITGWADEQTKKIEVAFPVYNGEYGLHTLIMCDFFFSRGGRIWTKVIPMSAFANWHMYWYNIYFDAAWLCCLVAVIVGETTEMRRIIRIHGITGLYWVYLDFWNFLDWLSIVSGLGIVVMFIANQTKTEAMNDALAELGLGAPDQGSDEYREKSLAYFMALETCVHYLYYFRMALASYPSVILVRLFKTFNFLPRLAVVAKTIELCWIDLVHYMIVFVSTFLMFAVSGVLLFGKDSVSFTTIFRSVNSCFLLLNGEIRWEDMRQIGREDAFLFLVSILGIMVMVMLNILFALVMDAYGEVTNDITHSKTLWREGKDIVIEWNAIRRKEKISLTKVRNQMIRHMETDIIEKFGFTEETFHVLEVGESESEADKNISSAEQERSRLEMLRKSLYLVKVSDFKTEFPQMHREQRNEIFTNAIMRFHDKNKESSQEREVLLMLKKMNNRTRKLKWLLKSKIKIKGRARDNLKDVTDHIEDCYGIIKSVRQSIPSGVAHGTASGYTGRRSHNESFAVFSGSRSSYPRLDLKAGTYISQLQRNDSSRFPDTFESLEDNQGNEESNTAALHKDNFAEKLGALESELQVGRETVSEALEAVAEFQAKLLKVKNEKRQEIGKFKELRQQAIKKESLNRAQREELQRGQVKLKASITERDMYFERVKQLLEENRDLEFRIQVARTE